MMSPLEQRFLELWREMGGPLLMHEYMFHPTRKWRFDVALPEIRTAIEIEGHKSHRGSRFSTDAQKYNAAALKGWTVFRLTGEMITAQHVGPVLEYTKSRLEEFRSTYKLVRTWEGS